MNNNLENLREEINGIDEQILKLLKTRFEIAQEIGKIKKEQGTQIDDTLREEELFEMYEKLARELGLDGEFVKKIFEEIILESKRIQTK
ncbi:MAG: chorismate mutase [Candidatus Magasanikbacteria bacterium]|nr:chorismate mutase [Candidatus Magasanikbacteria bacterium]